MQGVDWDDLRLFLVLVRAGSYARAGAEAGLHETTFARRIARLEVAMSAALWSPHSGGGQPTAAGLALVPVVARAEAALADAAGVGATATGRVRLSVVPWMVPVLAGAFAVAPLDVSLDVEAEQALRDPVRGEADIALRFARPANPQTALARKLCDVPFGVFRRIGAGAVPWVGYPDDRKHLPQAGWVAEGAVGHRVTDLFAAQAFVAMGLGKAYLPLCIAPPGTERLDAGGSSRPLWVLRHPHRRGDPVLERVNLWIAERLVPVLVAARPSG